MHEQPPTSAPNTNPYVGTSKEQLDFLTAKDAAAEQAANRADTWTYDPDTFLNPNGPGESSHDPHDAAVQKAVEQQVSAAGGGGQEQIDAAKRAQLAQQVANAQAQSANTIFPKAA